MRLQDNNELIDRIRLKQQLLAKGDDSHKNIRLLYMFDGGVMSGVFAGGVGVGMLESTIHADDGTPVSLFDTADTLVGCSAGTPPILYGLSRQSFLGYTIYPDKLSGNKFVNLKRAWRMVDINYLVNIFRTGERSLNLQRLLSSRSKAYTVLTHVKTGEKEIFDLKNEKALHLLELAITTPIVSGLKLVDTREYVDGFILPIKKIIEKFNPTDVVLVLNSPIGSHASEGPGLLDKTIGNIMGKVLHPKLRDSFLYRHGEFQTNMSFFENLPSTHNINIGVLAPHKHHIGRFEKSVDKIRNAGIEGAKTVLNIFAPHKKDEILKKM